MRGSVEVYAGDRLLYQENNLLVDGAGELLADIMTVSPSLSAIQDTATSSILDSSNYTIQAISFGTAAATYTTNAHFYSENKANLLSSTDLYAQSSVIAVMQQKDPGVTASKGVSSYSPDNLVPRYPDPMATSLEVSSDVSAAVSGVALSSLVPGNGHNLNLIPSAYHHAVFFNTALSSLSSMGGAFIGCWPDGSSLFGTEFSGFSGTDLGAGDVVYSGVYNGIFNEASSMDASGFVNMVMSGSPGTTDNYQMSSTASGLCLSGGNDFDGSGASGIVVYQVLLGSGDVGAANLYGGLFNMGLWTIDINKSLLKGNTPPYSFDPLNNSRTYRLFATKSFTRNLGRIIDVDPVAGCISYQDLLIKWSIHFL